MPQRTKSFTNKMWQFSPPIFVSQRNCAGSYFIKNERNCTSVFICNFIPPLILLPKLCHMYIRPIVKELLDGIIVKILLKTADKMVHIYVEQKNAWGQVNIKFKNINRVSSPLLDETNIMDVFFTKPTGTVLRHPCLNSFLEFPK